MSLSNDHFSAKITQEFAAKLGEGKVIGPRHQFPLHMRHTKRYSGPHWLLMGDAAHTIHPLAGLGLNVGLADVTTWLKNLPQIKQQAWSNKTLAAYQRQRKYEVWQMIALMEGLKAVFANSLPPISALREAGLSACNALKPLKRFLIEQAAGLN
jgi:2-octaprenylphenol hydroxylase